VVDHVVEGLLEYSKSVVVFLFGSVGSVILADEVDEGSFGITDGSSSQEGG
jgi:hypothetical protein